MNPPLPQAAPGPKGHFLLGSALDFKRSPLAFLQHLFHTYGDRVQFRLGPKTAFLFTHPDAVQHILQTYPERYPKGKIWDSFRQVSGNGLIASEGPYWRRQRQRIQPAFTHERLDSYSAAMTRTIGEMLERWEGYAQAEETFDVCPEMLKMVSLLAARSLFGVDEQGDAELTATFMNHLQSALASKIQGTVPLPLFVPTPTNRRIKSAKKRFDAVAERIIAEHRHHNRDREDLLSAMIDAQDDETGERMSNAQLRDEVMTLFVAGHETSARLMPFMLALIARHPEVEQRLVTEIHTVVGNRIPTFADVLKLTYAKQVFDESLRLYPPLYFIFRDAVQEDAIANIRIPQDAIVFVSPYLTHRHPDFWPNPETFNPDRFAVGAQERHRFAYFPFGGGPHTCIGSGFASLEVLLTLTMILQRFQIQIQTASIEIDSLLVLSPRNGVPITLHPRLTPSPTAHPPTH